MGHHDLARRRGCTSGGILKKLALATFLIFLAGCFSAGLFMNAGTIPAAIAGVAGAALTGLFVMRGLRRGQRRATAHKAEYEAEGLLQSAECTRHMPVHALGGWLFVTKRRVVFDSVFGDAHRLALSLEDIAEVHDRNELTNHRLEILTRSGETHGFSVSEEKRAMLAVAIEQALRARRGSDVA